MNKQHIDYLRGLPLGIVTADVDGKLSKGVGSAITSILFPLRVVTAAGDITVTSSDYTVGVFKTVPQNTNVNLPAGFSGARFEISDFADNAKTFNIEIFPNGTETIMGQPSMIISFNGGGVTLVWNPINSDRRII